MSSTATEVPLTPEALQAMARSAAVGAGLNPVQAGTFISLIGHESGWRPDVISPAGAIGLGQLMPATASSLGVTNPKDPVQNLRGSAQYFKQQLAAFGGNVDLALAAYNAGPAAVRKYGGVPPYAETQAYVKNVMSGATPLPPDMMQLHAPAITPQGMPGKLPTTGGAVVQPTQLQALAPAQQGAALQSQLQRIGGGWGGVTSALKSLGGVPSSVLSSLNTSVPKFKLPTLAEHQSVANQVSHFSFKNNGPMSPGGASAVSLAREYLGTPYVWGGESAKGFDCSGLIQFAWAKQGVNIPRTTFDQFRTGVRVPIGKLQPGDAVFFKGSDPKTVGGVLLPGHVAMYIGGGQVIVAPHKGATVEITKLTDIPNYMGARRYGTITK